jgi:hypothetical protein
MKTIFGDNVWRLHHANKAIAGALEQTGCPFPNATADLVLMALSKAGFYVVDQRN